MLPVLRRQGICLVLRLCQKVTRLQYTNSAVMPASMSECRVFVMLCRVVEAGQNQVSAVSPSIILYLLSWIDTSLFSWL